MSDVNPTTVAAEQFLKKGVSAVFWGAVSYGAFSLVPGIKEWGAEFNKSLENKAVVSASKTFDAMYRPILPIITSDQLALVSKDGGKEVEFFSKCMAKQEDSIRVQPTIQNGRISSEAREKSLDISEVAACFAEAKGKDARSGFPYILGTFVGIFGIGSGATGALRGIKSIYNLTAKGGWKPISNCVVNVVKDGYAWADKKLSALRNQPS